MYLPQKPWLKLDQTSHSSPKSVSKHTKSLGHPQTIGWKMLRLIHWFKSSGQSLDPLTEQTFCRSFKLSHEAAYLRTAIMFGKQCQWGPHSILCSWNRSWERLDESSRSGKNATPFPITPFPTKPFQQQSVSEWTLFKFEPFQTKPFPTKPFQ